MRMTTFIAVQFIIALVIIGACASPVITSEPPQAPVPAVPQATVPAPELVPSNPTPVPITPPPTISTATPTPVRTQGANEIWMRDQAFQPGYINVPIGTTVTWINVDTGAHTITSDDGLYNETIPPGKSFKITFNITGDFNYYCSIHSGIYPEIVTIFVK